MRQPLRLRFQVLAFAIIRLFQNTGYRMIYPFLPAIARGLGVNQESIALAITARASLGLFSPIFGSFAESRGRKAAMLVGAGMFTVGMALVAIWPTFPSLVISLLLVSTSKIIFDPAMQAYLGDRVHYRQRGLAIGLTEFGWSGAFLVGVPIVGWLIELAGWSSPFIWLALVGGGLTALLWRMLPPEARHTSARPAFREGLRVVLTNRIALAGLSLAFLLSAANESINIVYGSWMEGQFGLQVAAIGLVSTIVGIAELGGEGGVAALSDRLGKRRSAGIGIGVFGLACLLLPLLGGHLETALVGLFMFYAGFEFAVVSSIPLMTELMPQARATLMALNVTSFSLGRVMGSLIGQPLYQLGLGANGVVGFALSLIALMMIAFFVRENHAHQPAPAAE
jgi:predicted MFS family arabinose efflux permease